PGSSSRPSSLSRETGSRYKPAFSNWGSQTETSRASRSILSARLPQEDQRRRRRQRALGSAASPVRLLAVQLASASKPQQRALLRHSPPTLASLGPNPAVERTCSGRLRPPPPAAHLELQRLPHLSSKA